MGINHLPVKGLKITFMKQFVHILKEILLFCILRFFLGIAHIGGYFPEGEDGGDEPKDWRYSD